MITTMTLAQIDADKKAARQKVQKAIFAACKRMGIDEDTRRQIGARVTGKPTMTMMTLTQLRMVLADLNQRGGKHRGQLSPTQRLMFSLWQQLADAGAVQHRNFAALESFTRARTGVHKIVWLTGEQESEMISHLKMWLKRLPTSPAAAA